MLATFPVLPWISISSALHHNAFDVPTQKPFRIAGLELLYYSIHLSECPWNGMGKLIVS